MGSGPKPLGLVGGLAKCLARKNRDDGSSGEAIQLKPRATGHEEPRALPRKRIFIIATSPGDYHAAFATQDYHELVAGYGMTAPCRAIGDIGNNETPDWDKFESGSVFENGQAPPMVAMFHDIAELHAFDF